MLSGAINAILAFSGRWVLKALYGEGNFDLGEDGGKALAISLLNTFMLLFFPLLPLYIVAIVALGYNNRKNGKTSYTILGKQTEANLHSSAYKYNYLLNNAPRSILDFCENNSGNDSMVYFHILKAYQKGEISKLDGEIIWERYNSKTPSEVLKYGGATPETYQEMLEMERYLCKSIIRKNESKLGKCMMCKTDAELLLCDIKNNIGTRTLYICDECYKKFSKYSLR